MIRFVSVVTVVLTLVLSVTEGNNDNDVLDVEEEVVDYDLAADYDVGPLDEVGATMDIVDQDCVDLSRAEPSFNVAVELVGAACEEA